MQNGERKYHGKRYMIVFKIGKYGFFIKFSTDESVEDELDITLIPYDNPVNGKCTVKKKIINEKLEEWYGKYL